MQMPPGCPLTRFLEPTCRFRDELTLIPQELSEFVLINRVNARSTAVEKRANHVSQR